MSRLLRKQPLASLEAAGLARWLTRGEERDE